VAPTLSLSLSLPLDQVKRLEDQLDLNPAVLRFTILVVKIVFLCHLIACAWMFMHTIVSDRRGGWAGLGVGCGGWAGAGRGLGVGWAWGCGVCGAARGLRVGCARATWRGA
jgi:hypothetical protein